MPGRTWIIIGALLAALGVLAGAFGAHVLKQQVKDRQQPVDTSSLGETVIPPKQEIKPGQLSDTAAPSRKDELHALRDAEHKLEVFDTAAQIR